MPQTDRRMQIVGLLAQGYTKQEVGDELRISVNTVKTHVAIMCAEVGAHNVAHLVAIAYQERWFPLPERRKR